MQKQRRGFTLVELLVVIGIIALLISILLPALNKARQSALRVSCASLMRQALQVTRMYAGDNHDYLPPFRVNDFGGNLSSVFGYQQIFDEKATPNTGASLGRLIGTGYYGKVNPQATDWQPTFTRLQQKYGMCPAADDSMLSQTSNYRANYEYEPHVAYHGTNLTRWWPKLTGYGLPPKTPTPATNGLGVTDPAHVYTTQMALISDPINDIGFATHRSGKTQSWNLGYADGSVRIAVVNPQVGRQAGSWSRMLDMLGYLEAVADQGAVSPPNTWNKYNWIPKLD